jgi:endo-alpha-1,4-polygalactosaminidase (GH114 family)
MDRTIKNSNEQHILNLLIQGKQIIEKYEDKYLEGEAKDILKSELEKVRDELVEIQNRRILDLIDRHQTLDNLPQEEYNVQNEMTDLIMKINELIGSETW